MLIAKPTGISNYIYNIYPYLERLEPISLAPENYLSYQNNYNISKYYSPDYGSKGHFLRLLWTQIRLPNLYNKLQGNLLFSPVPEAPLTVEKYPCVIMVHDLIPLRFPRFKSPLTYYFKYYVPWVCQQATHIICNSQSTADDLINFFGVESHKITPIHLGINNNKFKVITNINKQNYFIYLGRHDPHKNLDRIIKAFAQFNTKKNYQLWLVGAKDSRYTPALIALIEELNITSQVKFFDYVSSEELILMLNQAQALVFTTLWEGFGFPVLEAMACGLPVITSDISALKEIARDASLLVNPYDINSIVSAMKKIRDDDQLRQDLTQAGLAKVKQFSWQKTGKETVKILADYQK
ncbi:MAG: glycosyltransferase family 4 protein [Cyanobacterium sp. T60_A2020_053]|nr:glycosyltransferase family 4 protein [Cyanobacterium sp. T60_A2020_053]